jgi:hypothetical protein
MQLQIRFPYGTLEFGIPIFNRSPESQKYLNSVIPEMLENNEVSNSVFFITKP